MAASPVRVLATQTGRRSHDSYPQLWEGRRGRRRLPPCAPSGCIRLLTTATAVLAGWAALLHPCPLARTTRPERNGEAPGQRWCAIRDSNPEPADQESERAVRVRRWLPSDAGYCGGKLAH
jgi:hypothetical protein